MPLPTQLFALGQSLPFLSLSLSLSYSTDLLEYLPRIFGLGKSNRKGSTLPIPLASLVHPCIIILRSLDGVFYTLCFFFVSFCALLHLRPDSPTCSLLEPLNSPHFYLVHFEMTLLVRIPTIPSSSPSSLPTASLLLPKSVCSTSERLTRVILLFSAYTSQDA